MSQNATIPGLGDEVASSLDTTSETVDDVYRECYRRQARVLININNPAQILQTGCDAYVCHFCGPHKARQFARAASWVLTQHKHPRFITLTNAPEDWQKRRQKVRDLSRRIRSEGLSSEIAFTTEVGSNTGMIHLHCLQWGDYIPQHELQQWWGSIVDVRAVKVTHKAVGEYVTKSAHGVGRYIAKSTAADYQYWLQLNGGRPLHSSRGFFMGLGVRGATVASNEAWRKGEPIKWAKATPEMLRVHAAFTVTGDMEHVDYLRGLLSSPELSKQG